MNKADNYPLVSVLIRSMGRPELHRALGSVAAQIYPRIEIVVIDALGNAHPPVPDKCGPYPVRLCSSGKRLPRAEAANLGLDHAVGDYLVFLDDDDFFDPAHVRKLMEALHRARGFMLAYSGMRVLDQDGGYVGVMSEGFNSFVLFERNLLPISAAMFSRRLVELGCRFDPTLDVLEDWDFWIQCARHTHFLHTPDVSVNYLAESGSSGCGLGSNIQSNKIDSFRQIITAKWSDERRKTLEKINEYLDSGRQSLQSGHYQEASSLFSLVLDIHPQHVNALNLLGMTRYSAGEPEAALPLIREAIALRGDVAGFRYNLGLVLEALGDTNAALSSYREAIERDATFVPAQTKLTIG